MPDYHLKFLQAEELATARLMGFYAEARVDIEFAIRSGRLTVSSAAYHSELLKEVARISARAEKKATAWVGDVIPEAYLAGHSTHSQVVAPQAALEALSRNALQLIRSTTEGIRDSIRQAIAGGILQGLNADQVRDRILSSGLTNIPHWPTVEYRAGVIARTETMGAYNAGVMAGIEDSGAVYAEWIASPDEATCPVCLPRDGKVFRTGDPPAGPDPYPNALPMPKLPAHPRCRCTARAVFRDPNGDVIRQGVPDVDPSLPSDAMGGDMPARIPPSIGEIESECQRRWAQAQRELDSISNRVLGLLGGRTVPYELALDAPKAALAGDLAGFENRAKSLSSMIRKVKGLFEIEGSLMSPSQAADSIGDLLRYTARFNPSEYTESVMQTVRRMKAAGYTNVKWKPSWDSDVYRGINTNWRSPDGTVFELQFHTPESFKAKELNHVAYEKERELPAGDPRRNVLNDQMSDRMMSVDRPNGWERLSKLP